MACVRVKIVRNVEKWYLYSALMSTEERIDYRPFRLFTCCRPGSLMVRNVRLWPEQPPVRLWRIEPPADGVFRTALGPTHFLGLATIERPGDNSPLSLTSPYPYHISLPSNCPTAQLHPTAQLTCGIRNPENPLTSVIPISGNHEPSQPRSAKPSHRPVKTINISPKTPLAAPIPPPPPSHRPTQTNRNERK